MYNLCDFQTAEVNKLHGKQFVELIQYIESFTVYGVKTGNRTTFLRIHLADFLI